MPRRRSPPRISRRLLVEIGVLVLAAFVALALRTWVIGIYQIPSASMMPRLLPGDYVLVGKWRFAVEHRLPQRGDMVVVRLGRQAYAKRVIGLPGDRIALDDGRLILDGAPVPRWRVADFLFAPSAATPCRSPEPQPKGPASCRAIRIREMPPGAAPFDTLDLGASDGDDFAAVTVPAGRLFLLGDNRDRSADSRSVLGMVPASAIVGRTDAILFSVGTGPWWRSIRWDRIGALE